MKLVFNHSETETETETEIDLSQKISLSPKKSKKSKPLEGPTIVFESRISELEAQLTQAKIDLRKALEENANYKKKLQMEALLMGWDLIITKNKLKVSKGKKMFYKILYLNFKTLYLKSKIKKMILAIKLNES
ncbi:hypothetical protein MTP99_007534 [Tenebrio molitor]|nr:hypothetical protein MTP99_007534 [Tenebrio molitor]